MSFICLACSTPDIQKSIRRKEGYQTIETKTNVDNMSVQSSSEDEEILDKQAGNNFKNCVNYFQKYVSYFKNKYFQKQIFSTDELDITFFKNILIDGINGGDTEFIGFVYFLGNYNFRKEVLLFHTSALKTRDISTIKIITILLEIRSYYFLLRKVLKPNLYSILNNVPKSIINLIFEFTYEQNDDDLIPKIGEITFVNVLEDLVYIVHKKACSRNISIQERNDLNELSDRIFRLLLIIGNLESNILFYCNNRKVMAFLCKEKYCCCNRLTFDYVNCCNKWSMFLCPIMTISCANVSCICSLMGLGCSTFCCCASDYFTRCFCLFEEVDRFSFWPLEGQTCYFGPFSYKFKKSKYSFKLQKKKRWLKWLYCFV